MIVHEDAVTFVHSHPERDLEPQIRRTALPVPAAEAGRLSRVAPVPARRPRANGRVSDPSRGQSVKRTAAVSLACVIAVIAHEGGMKNLKPTKAAADLKRAWEALSAAKRKLTAAGPLCLLRQTFVQSLRAGQRIL